mgnify:CR=1 FL=1
MKKILIGVIIFLPAVFVYALQFQSATAHTDALADPKSHPAEWVCCAFDLDDSTSQAIKEAQDQYMPHCEQLCQNFMEAKTALDLLQSDPNASEDEVAAAALELQRCQDHCQSNGLAHIENIASKLPADQRKEYLSIMRPQIVKGHGGPTASGSMGH